MSSNLTTCALAAVFVLSLGLGGGAAWIMQAAPVQAAAAPARGCAANAPALDCPCAAQRTRHILDAASPRIPGLRYASAWDLAESQRPPACRQRF
ncbi:hypothetical protein MAA8898_00589 [Maliponia aquimaris]|uniref:Uncharacterized protein n=1 Tax=Maliponia aquimaris TaxID=1673631 RepID=A0A238K0I0_9RHOB|nr:hypothetical protein MAA8898_00589 [Maliponia aquimaris]